MKLEWKQNATTIVEKPRHLYETSLDAMHPRSLYISKNQHTIYIADQLRNYIIEQNLDRIYYGSISTFFPNRYIYKYGQLKWPSDIIVDEKNNSLIICDRGHKRVVRSPVENQEIIETIISNINCYGLMMNENRDLFVSDSVKHKVIKWSESEKVESIVAGGHGKGNKLNQLNHPTYIFIDRNDTVYITDSGNHRVIKWTKGAEEGIVVAGEKGQGNSFEQLSRPHGVFVKGEGDVYVADCDNNRIMCWPSGMKKGHVVVGGNGPGNEPNQLRCPTDLEFDHKNNLYVADFNNYRVQRFDID